MSGRELFRQRTNDKQTPKHKLGNRTNRWSKVQADARYPSCKKQFKQKRQQCRLKDDLIFNLRISREFKFVQFVYTVRDIPNRICETAANFEREILKLSSYSSLSLKYAERGYFTLLFHCDLLNCKQRRRNEQRIITHAYTVSHCTRCC